MLVTDSWICWSNLRKGGKNIKHLGGNWLANARSI